MSKTLRFRRTIYISWYGLGIALAGIAVLWIAVASMNTAADRLNYLIMYDDPLWEARIEPLFVEYLLLLKRFGLSPEQGTVFTVVLIWYVYGLSWQRLCNLPWWESLMMFSIFMMGVNNYFLNVALRNGLAAAVGIYAGTRVLEGKKHFWLLLLGTPFIHISMIYFVTSVGLTMLTRGWRKSYLVGFLGIVSVMFVVLHDTIYLQALALLGRGEMYGGYYERYLEAVGTDRLRGYSMILFSILMLSLIRAPDHIVHRLVFFAMPGLMAYMAFGASAYTRPIAPHLLFALIAFLNIYSPVIRRLVSSGVWAWGISACLIFSILYALKMYGIL
jgi:hypothetical protein